MQQGDQDRPCDADASGPAGQRVDKWLWCARVVKSRTQAAALVGAGKVRLNRVRVLKPSQPLRPGDAVTIGLREKVLVLRVVQTAVRRGSAEEARSLYEDLSASRRPAAGAGSPAGPDAAERHVIDRRRGRD